MSNILRFVTSPLAPLNNNDHFTLLREYRAGTLCRLSKNPYLKDHKFIVLSYVQTWKARSFEVELEMVFEERLTGEEQVMNLNLDLRRGSQAFRRFIFLIMTPSNTLINPIDVQFSSSTPRMLTYMHRGLRIVSKSGDNPEPVQTCAMFMDVYSIYSAAIGFPQRASWKRYNT